MTTAVAIQGRIEPLVSKWELLAQHTGANSVSLG
jgi:hypothetical protein